MPSSHVPLSLHRRVRERARDCCEYRHISQASQEATFHIDHVLPRHLGGPTTLDSLAWCCVSCSLRKGGRVEALDPATNQLVPIFNPRTEVWEDHFLTTDTFLLLGRTPGGRATVESLRMNRPLAIELRRETALRGR